MLHECVCKCEDNKLWIRFESATENFIIFLEICDNSVSLFGTRVKMKIIIAIFSLDSPFDLRSSKLSLESVLRGIRVLVHPRVRIRPKSYRDFARNNPESRFQPFASVESKHLLLPLKKNQ